MTFLHKIVRNQGLFLLVQETLDFVPIRSECLGCSKGNGRRGQNGRDRKQDYREKHAARKAEDETHIFAVARIG